MAAEGDQAGAVVSTATPNSKEPQTLARFAHNGIVFQVTDRTRMTRDQPIAIIVGTKKIKFWVHKSLLSRRSAYFDSRLKACWDGNKESVEINDITPEEFEVVIEWMYTLSLPAQSNDFTRRADHWEYEHYRKVYRAADRLLMNDLQNTLMDKFVFLHVKKDVMCLPSTVLNIVADGLYHTPLYTYVVKSAAKQIVENGRDGSHFDEAFAGGAMDLRIKSDLLSELINYLGNPWTNHCADNICTFHIHTDEDKCD